MMKSASIQSTYSDFYSMLTHLRLLYVYIISFM